MKIIVNIKFGIACLAIIVATTVAAGVCKIGNTEYESLQAALESKTSASADFTVTLLSDIDVTSAITVPSFNSSSPRTCTVDGDGHVIRQSYAGRVFDAPNDFTQIVFKDVTILGGGAECATGSDVPGAFFHFLRGASSLTLDSGCVVSNFVFHSILIGDSGSLAAWNIYVRPGSVIAYNRATSQPGIFRLAAWANSSALYISGGDIYGNSASGQTIAYLDALGKNRSNPIVVISSGQIYGNAVTSGNDTSTGLFYCDYGPIDIEISGGEIFDNTGTVFRISRGIDSGKNVLSRVHVSGGKIFANSGYAVYDGQLNLTGSMLLSGDAIVAGNGSGGINGLFESSEYKATARTALEGDFAGFAYLSGTGQSTLRSVGSTYGTNLASYVGAERIYLAGYSIRVLQTDATTGALKWQEPKSAKIGTTEYATLAAALSSAADGATIELLRDCLMTASIVPPANKTITIDGAGYRIFRRMKDPLVKATTTGGNMTFTNVELNEGYFTHRDAYTNHVDGVIVNTSDGVTAMVTLGSGTILSGGRGTNALVRVANGATVNLDGCVITGAVNRAIAASAGGTLGVKGATIVKGNAGGDIDVANGNILALNGDLTGSVHVTVAGAEACEGQRFGTKTGSWSGAENFINGGSDPKLVLAKSDSVLVWCRRGFKIIFR